MKSPAAKGRMVGIVSSGRFQQEMENVAGMFAKILPVCCGIDPDATLTQYIRDIHEFLIAAFSKQIYDLSNIISDLNQDKATALNDIIEAAFVLQNFGDGRRGNRGTDFKPVPLESFTAKYPLMLIVEEWEGEILKFSFEYLFDYFTASDMEMIGRQFMNVLDKASGNLNGTIVEVLKDGGPRIEFVDEDISFSFDHVKNSVKWFTLPGSFLFPFSLAFWIPVSLSYGQTAPGNSKGHKHFEGLNSAVERMMDSVGIPGLSLAVIENNWLVYFHPYGRKNDGTRHKVDKRTVFEACSLSKNFLSYVAHQLVDEGKLDVQKPVYEYLPNDRLEHDARYKLITAHEILAHCSGIENWQVFNNPDTLEIVSNPGEKFVYSGEAFNYLAQIIAKILGQPYEEYMTERVTRPLHLHDTYFRFTKQTSGSAVKVHPADFATPTYTFGNTGYKWINTEPLPSSAVNVNARDYARLLIALFNYRHLSVAETRKLWQPVREGECS